MQVGELTSEEGPVAVLSSPSNLHGPEASLDCRKGSVDELVVEDSSAPEVAAGGTDIKVQSFHISVLLIAAI